LLDGWVKANPGSEDTKMNLIEEKIAVLRKKGKTAVVFVDHLRKYHCTCDEA